MRTEESFAPVVEVAALFSNLRCPWFIAGGWAIDIFLREVTRIHDDVDVAILRRDQRTVRTFLGDWTLVEKFVEGRTEPWRDGEWLALPIHEIHARRSAGAPQEIELLLNETANDRWVFRRDARITRPLSKIALRFRSGVPFLGPEIVLLYKAKDPKTKDVADFNHALPRLGPEHRRWLHRALETCHPDHPWIARL